MEEIFEFNIGEMKMKVSIMFKNDIWSSEVLEGDSGMGNASGGIYEGIEEYKKYLIRAHTYCYNFFSKGYAYAIKHHGV